MSYHIYNTKGIILSERSVREADRIYSILTRELGLIRATAQGVRKEASKLRSALEPFSLSLISLVRGKEYWRITSAQFVQNISSIKELIKPLSLLERLVQGEDPHRELFDVIEEAINFAGDRDEMFEIQLVAKILYQLGYLQKSDLNLNKKALIQAINKGIQASQLT
ncbi:MAG: DNA repair protein RecO [Patescibacteria group bacterium]